MAWTTASSIELNGLWALVYKMNSDAGGFTFKAWLAASDKARARTVGEDLGDRIKNLLPTDAEIYFAVAYCMDGSRNAMALRACRGKGLWGSLATPAVETKVDNSHSAIKLRFEDIDLGVVPRKFSLVPDLETTADDTASAVTDVVGIPVAAPAGPLAADTWVQQFNKFMQAFMFYTVHVQKGFIPGGVYKYKAWDNGYTEGLGVKKGGRVFI